MKRCCRNLRWKDSVTGYEYNGLRNTYYLRQSLLNDDYYILPYQHFTIYEPKQRDIVATRFRDRQFQMSLCRSGLYSDITEHFIRDNSACQTGRGTDDTLRRLTAQLRRYYRKYGNTGWVLHCDIKKFFPSTKHSIAKQEVSKYIEDKEALFHVFQIIDSFDDGDAKGIGLGSQVSQLIELSVLTYLDHYIREVLHPDVYVRYMDDYVIVHHNKEELKYILSEIQRIIEEFGFILNSKTQIHPLRQGIKLMKWTFYITDTGKILKKLAKSKLGKQRRKLKHLWYRECVGTIEPNKTQESLRSFLAHAEKGNTYQQRRRMIKYFEKLTNQKYISKPSKIKKGDKNEVSEESD